MFRQGAFFRGKGSKPTGFTRAHGYIVSITEPVKSEVIPKCPHAPKSPHAPKKSILDFSFYVRNGKLNSPGEN